MESGEKEEESVLSKLMNADTTSSASDPELDEGPLLGRHGPADEILNGNVTLQESQLGNALDNLMGQWAQLLTHIVTDVGHVPPTSDHVKEMAEFSVKEACLELTTEFHKAALDWRLSHPEESVEEDLEDLREAVAKQSELNTRMEEAFDQTIDSLKYGT